MQRKYHACTEAMFLSTAMIVCGTLLVLVGNVSGQGPLINDSACVTQLNPATCAAGGNSMCNAASKEYGVCVGTCFFCNSTQAVAHNICVDWEGFRCVLDGQPAYDCGSTNNFLRGDCGLSPTCLCENLSYVRACGNSVMVFGCTNPL